MVAVKMAVLKNESAQPEKAVPQTVSSEDRGERNLHPFGPPHPMMFLQDDNN